MMTETKNYSRFKEEMESHQILSKPKLGFTSSFRESFKILYNHPKFISLTVLLSLPLLASLLAHRTLLHPAFIRILKLLHRKDRFNPSPLIFISVARLCNVTNCISHDQQWQEPPSMDDSLRAILSHQFLIFAILLSALVFVVDLLNTIAVVSISAALYGGSTSQMGFKEMMIQAKRVDLKGPLTTSLYAVLLASLTLLGLVVLSTDMFFMARDPSYMPTDIFFISKLSILTLVFGSMFVVLLGKYIEWSAVWNMGIVISVLDKNQGYIAIGVAGYLSRSKRKLGFCLMLVFFGLKVAFGMPCLYSLLNEGKSCGILGNVVSLGLNCVGNVVMWVVLVVYFYDCKREFLEKKVDLENGGKAVEAVQQ